MRSGCEESFLVTGASGLLGRRVVELLLQARVGRVIAATRTPSHLAGLAGRGAIVREADADDPETLRAAFRGAKRMLLVSARGALEPERIASRHRNALVAAQAEGIEFVAYTSMVRPEAGSPVAASAVHRETEALLPQMFGGWAALRLNVLTDDLLQEIREAVLSGRLFGAPGDPRVAYVAREDCACVAACVLGGTRVRPLTLNGAALLDSANRKGVALDVTGPEAVSYSELADLITRETGHVVTYVPIPDLLSVSLRASSYGYPEARGKLSLEEGMAQGRFAETSPAVESLIGRRPVSVADFLAWNRDAVLPRAERAAG